MGERDAPRGVADRARGEYEFLGLDRQRLPARQPHEDRCRRDADRDHRVGEARTEERGKRDRQDQERAREHRVGQPRDQHDVDPAAGVAGDEPDGTPTDSESSTETTPASKDAREPQMTRDSTSRPISSVPNQWAELGAFRIAAQLVASGSYGATNGASSASGDEEADHRSPIAAPRRRSSRRNGCARGVRRRSIVTDVDNRRINGPDPWVDRRRRRCRRAGSARRRWSR